MHILHFNTRVCVCELCVAMRRSYSGATVYLQVRQFVGVSIVLVFMCFLASLLFPLITVSVRQAEQGYI